MTQVNVVRSQPVPFSHEHHVAGLGIDCRFCHTTVEESAFAGIPPTETCMKCHFSHGGQRQPPGPVVAFSPDGLRWTMHDDGRPVLPVGGGDDSWHAGYDPLRRRYFLFGKRYGPLSIQYSGLPFLGGAIEGGLTQRTTHCVVRLSSARNRLQPRSAPIWSRIL